MSRATQDTARLYKKFVYGIITLYDQVFQLVPLSLLLATAQSYNPGYA